MTAGRQPSEPPAEIQALARALHEARMQAIEDPTEQMFARMLGSFGEDYARAPVVRDLLAERGWFLVKNLLAPADDETRVPS